MTDRPPESKSTRQNVLLVTGQLAEPSLQRLKAQLEQNFEISVSIQKLPITVAALMTPAWIAKHLQVSDEIDRIILPGYCHGDLDPITQLTDKPIEFGPRDLRRLPEYLGGKMEPVDLDAYTIQIIAEINHAPRQTIEQIIQQAETLRIDNADVIDIGCDPGQTWTDIGTVVKELVDRGLKVSVDSLNPKEIAMAANAGACLVLSVNSSNRDAADDWGCEVVVIPDRPDEWRQMEETANFLEKKNVPFRIDPILEPVGFGFANSLSRYMEARKMWPDAEMMMGIGNLTELSDVDSSGINFLLLAICEELNIRSVLTTQVINWARSSVRECDIARRLVHLAVSEKIPPKNISPQLICLRDPRITRLADEEIVELAAQIRDHNYRIVSDGKQIHLLGSGMDWHDEDAFELFFQLMESDPKNVDPSHAFYLGYEMCKATIANQLGKNYEQDESLDWGHLTVEEVSHRRLKRGHAKSNRRKKPE